jgi:hypothetical protein
LLVRGSPTPPPALLVLVCFSDGISLLPDKPPPFASFVIGILGVYYYTQHSIAYFFE